MNNIQRAKFVAEKVHATQSYGIYPYMFHIEQVVGIAKDLGFDEEIIVSCYLHDAMEDGNLSYNDIKKAFGVNVAEIVFAVTDELGRNRKERKQKTYPKIKANWKAIAVKICDRIANVRESKLYDKNLYDMYEKERVDFRFQLFDKEHEHNLRIAWDELTFTFSEWSESAIN
jgi:(p)ppGpp synthase/HD superfamily hydrolase